MTLLGAGGAQIGRKTGWGLRKQRRGEATGAEESAGKAPRQRAPAKRTTYYTVTPNVPAHHSVLKAVTCPRVLCVFFTLIYLFSWAGS